MLTRLALFMQRLKNPDTRPDTMALAGPKVASRFAFTRDDEQSLAIVYDAVDGPKRDEATELIMGAILESGDGRKALIVTLQTPTTKVGEVSKEEHAMLGDTFESYLLDDRDGQFAAKGDTELDGQGVIIVYATDTDGTYTPHEVSAKLDDYQVDGAMSLVYAAGEISLVPTAQFTENLLDDASTADNGAVKAITVGQGVKLTRGPDLPMGTAKISTWAYVVSDGSGGMKMVLLDKSNLDKVAEQPFDGTFATAGHDRDEIIFVFHTPGGPDVEVEPETFSVTRAPVAQAFKPKGEVDKGVTTS